MSTNRSTQTDRVFRFGPFELSERDSEFRKNGVPIKLQEQPFRVLAELAANAGRVVTREELQQKLWSADTFVDFDVGLNNVIRKLRQALGDDADHPHYIETLSKRGYRFVALVTDTALQPMVAPDADTTVAPIGEDAPAVSSRRTWVWLAAAGCVIAVAASMAGLYLRWKQSRLTEKETIVLADFVNTTGDPVFDDALKLGLRVQLEQSPFLNILSDEEVDKGLQLMGRPKGEHLTNELARDLCQRMGTKAVVAGSIATFGTQYVIGLSATNCATGKPLDNEQIQVARKEEVLSALDKITRQLRRKVGEPLSSIQKYDTPLEQATTPSLEALKAFSTAEIIRYEQGDTPAIPLLERAIELDPNFAVAHAVLGSAYMNQQQPGLAAESFRKAYDLRGRVSEGERFYIESHYYQFVTGELEKAIQVYDLWARTDPTDPGPLMNVGNIYASLGQYEKAVAKGLEALHRDPGYQLPHGNLVSFYTSLNQFDQAKATYQRALAHKVDPTYAHFALYSIASLQGDTGEMMRQVVWAQGKPGLEDRMLAEQADTEAFYGRLKNARELSRSAVESARRGDQRQTAALWQINAALREAQFGNLIEARQDAAAALALASTSDVQTQTQAALVLAQAGRAAQAERMAEDLARRFPLDTLINGYWLPTIRAAIQLDRKNPAQAIEGLRDAASYELGALPSTAEWSGPLHPAYLRGQAYLLLHEGKQAAAEYQKFLDHRGIVRNCTPGAALAYVGLARAYALQGDTAKARAAYEDFFMIWKDADADVPILKDAKAEYAKLQ